MDFASISDQQKTVVKNSVASGMASFANVAARAVSVKLSAGPGKVDASTHDAAANANVFRNQAVRIKIPR